MGHDIIAARTIDTDRLTNHLARVAWTDKEWEHRLDDFPHCAHLRRSAWDKFGRVIYRALSAEDLYTGCSGIGETLCFDRTEIKAALDNLPGIVADKVPPIDTEQVERMSLQLGVPNIEQDEREAPSLADEQEFLMDIITWMDNNGHDTVEVYFG